jgi:hypothetical protein
MIEGGAKMGAVDGGDGAGAADVRRDFAVAGFDLIAEDVSLVVYQTIRTGAQIQNKNSSRAPRAI